MKKHTILWPTDFSSAAARALPTVREMVHRKSSQVHLLYVADDLAGFERYWGTGPDSRHEESLKVFAERRAKERLRQICTCELEGCPDYDLHFALGQPAEEILRAAERLDVDLIVVAKPPTGGPTSFGAVVETLVAQSPIEVQVVEVPASADAPACQGPA